MTTTWVWRARISGRTTQHTPAPRVLHVLRPPGFGLSLFSVLSLWKLRVGSEAYYLSQVASGLDDYYSGSGEAAGEWTGSAAGSLGLVGEVAGEDLRAVLAGLAPGFGLTEPASGPLTCRGDQPP
jgi:TrwC relaxase